jgi:hypothetical protein
MTLSVGMQNMALCTDEAAAPFGGSPLGTMLQEVIQWLDGAFEAHGKAHPTIWASSTDSSSETSNRRCPKALVVSSVTFSVRQMRLSPFYPAETVL